MKLSKKIFCLIVLIIAGFILFGNFNISKNEKIILTYSSWGSDSEIKIIKPIIKEYENTHPNIKIEFMHIPQNYFQKIHLLFVSKTQPDVVFINNLNIPIYANSHVLEPLDKYFTNQELKIYYPQALNSMKWENRIYAIPRDISTLVVFYNKDLFKKNKIPLPKNNWTLNDFLEIAQKISHPPEVFGVSFEEDPYFYLPFVTVNGGGFLPDKYKTLETKEAIRFYSDLRKKYHVSPSKKDIGSATMAQMFLSEKIGMQISGRWLVPKYRQEANFDWDVINFPKGKYGNKIPLDSSGWAIAKNSLHKKEAAEFIKFLSSYNNLAKMTESGLIVPARKDVAESNLFLYGHPNSKVFLDSINTSIPTPVNLHYKEILDNIKTKNEYAFN